MMNCIKKFEILLMGILILISQGLAEARQPQVQQFNSGSKKTQEWIEYNKYAEKNNKPILDFAVTTLKYKFNQGKILSYDHFLVDDATVVIEAKWHNCKISDFYEFKFYMPDGRLYGYRYSKMKQNYDRYTVGGTIYIKGVFPSKIQGKWTAKVFANGKLAMSKHFTIGNPKEYKKAKTDVNIGVLPYVDDEEISTWKHGVIMPRYISWAILDQHKNVKVIPTNELRKDLPNVNISYKTFKHQIEDDLLSVDSYILKIAKKYSLNYVILGRVQSLWQGNFQNTIVDTYIIDVKNRNIIDSISTSAPLNMIHHIGYVRNTEWLHPLRIEVYKKIYEDLDKRIEVIIK